eukprot:12332-Heterococcus_DN1.PRE.1
MHFNRRNVLNAGKRVSAGAAARTLSMAVPCCCRYIVKAVAAAVAANVMRSDVVQKQHLHTTTMFNASNNVRC